MPSGALGADKRVVTDFVVGDRYGTSAAVELVQVLERAMRERGFVVQRNKPYAGGYITEHYGTPAAGVHAIQIEVNRRDLHGRDKARAQPALRADGRGTSPRSMANLLLLAMGYGLKTAAE